MYKFLKPLLLLVFALQSFAQNPPTFIPREQYNDFEKAVNTAKSMGRKDYVALINKHLENDQEPFIFGICDYIKQDSLIECIPNLKKYITNCDRDQISTDCSLYRLAQIGSPNEKDFIVDDFQSHLNQKLNTLPWLKSYIQSLILLNYPDGHHLVDQAFFDWTGINLDFAQYPKLFEIKKTLETQYYFNFPQQLIQEGYKLTNVIAFMDNTTEVAKANANPKVRYIVEIEFPYGTSYPYGKDSTNEEASLQKIQELTKLPPKYINLKYNDGGYYIHKEDRFDNSSLTVDYIDYITKFPNANGLHFIQFLHKRNYFTDYDKYYVENYLEKQKE